MSGLGHAQPRLDKGRHQDGEAGGLRWRGAYGGHGIDTGSRGGGRAAGDGLFEGLVPDEGAEAPVCHGRELAEHVAEPGGAHGPRRARQDFRVGEDSDGRRGGEGALHSVDHHGRHDR